MSTDFDGGGSIDQSMSKRMKYLAAMVVVLAGTASPLLVAAQTSQKNLPRLADIMTAIQFRHLKLWTAGQQQNWELAGYELDLVKAGLMEAITFYTDIPVTNVTMVDAPLKSIDSAIVARSSAGFAKAFNELTVGCNACHQSIDRGYIAVTVPATSPFSNQSFAPRQAKDKMRR
jgi:hypothetical protein